MHLIRIGKQVQRAIDEIDIAKKKILKIIYKRAKGYIQAATINEKATITTTTELAGNQQTFAPVLNKFLSSIDATGQAAVTTFDSYAEVKTKSLGVAKE